MSPNDLFVDTTVLNDLSIGVPNVRAVLTKAMRGRTVRSSTYVIMEYRRTGLYALELVRAIIDGASAAKPLEALARVSDALARGYVETMRKRLNPNDVSRCNAVMRMLLKAIESAPSSRALLLAVLDGQIERARATQASLSLVDNTNCDLVQPSRPQSKKWPLSCNKREARCKQRIFLDAKRVELRSIVNACHADKGYDDKRFLKIAHIIVGSPHETTLGKERCFPLGDAIIALEAAATGELMTSNGKHYRPMGVALGLHITVYSPY